MNQFPRSESRPLLSEAFIVLSLGFAGSLVICQILASKVGMVILPGIGRLIFPAGIVAYATTFAFTDAIEEVWGKSVAQKVVKAGFWVNLLIWGHILLARSFPSAPFWEGEGWEKVFSSATRIIFASMVAYLSSQYHDLWMFDLIRRLTRGRYLWLRNTFSTILSQTIDTTIFITIAFWGKAPIIPLIVGQLVLKWLIAVADTPFVYLMVYWGRRSGKMGGG